MKNTRSGRSKALSIRDSSDSSSEDDVKIPRVNRKKPPKMSDDDFNDSRRPKGEKESKKTKKSNPKASLCSSQSSKIKENVLQRSDSSSSKEFQKPYRKSKVGMLSVSADYSTVETPTRSDDEDIPVDKELENTLKKYMLNEITNIEKISASLNIELDCLKTYTLDKKIDYTHKSKFLPHKILRIYESFFTNVKQSQKKFAELYSLWLDDCRQSCSNTTKSKSEKKFSLSSDESDKFEKESNKSKENSKKTKQLEKTDKLEEIENRKSLEDVENVEENIADEAPNEIKEMKKSANVSKVVLEKLDVSTSGSYHSCSEVLPVEQGVISGCDSEEIFTDDESRISCNKKTEKEKNTEKKEESSDDEEIENTPTKSPAKSAMSLRKTLLMSTTIQAKPKTCEDENENEKSDHETVNNDEGPTNSPVMFDNDDKEVLSEVNKSCTSISSENKKQTQNTNERAQTLKKNEQSFIDIDQNKGTVDEDLIYSNTKKTRQSHDASSNASQVETDGKVESDHSSSAKKAKKNRKSSIYSSQDENNDEKDSNCSSSAQKSKKPEKTSEDGKHESDVDENLDRSVSSKKTKKSQKRCLSNSEGSENSNHSLSTPKNKKPLNISKSDSQDERDIDVVMSPKKIIQSENDDGTDLIYSSTRRKTNKSFSQDESNISNDSIYTSNRKTKEILNQDKKDNEDLNNSKNSTQSAVDVGKDSSHSSFSKRINKSVNENESGDQEDLNCSKNSNINIKDGQNLEKSHESPIISSADENDDVLSPKLENRNKNSEKKSHSLSVSTSSSEDENKHKSKKRKLDCSPELGKPKLSSRREYYEKYEDDSSGIALEHDETLKREDSIEIEIEKAGLENLVKGWSESEISVMGDSDSCTISHRFDSVINLEGLETPNKRGKSLKNKKSTSKSKSLMEDLENFGMDELSDCTNSDNDFDQGLGVSDPEFLSNKNMRDKIEENAKSALLESTSNDEIFSVDESEKPSSPKKKSKSKSVKFTASKENEVVNLSDDIEDENGDNWRDDELLQFKLSDGSETEEEKWNRSQEKKKQSGDEVDEARLSQSPVKKKPNKKTKRRVLKSDSENEFQVSSNSGSEKSEGEEVKVKEKKKRQRRRKAKSSDSEDSLEAERPKVKRRRIKKTADTDSEDGSDKDKSAKGRKNIRKVIKDKHIADDTKQAAKEEEERLKRIAERQKLFNDLYLENLEKEAKVDKLVLDIDEETKKELVVVHQGLVKRLKPHQADGIKFMWNACFESIEQIQRNKGSGCIIAHCMGLGKTFQVVALAHTLLMNEATTVKTIMVVCPLSTVLNWVNEFKIWLKYTPDIDDIEIYELTKMKKNFERKYVLESWQRTGGVLVIGYEMFRNLTAKNNKKMRKQMYESIQKCLVDPGADLVICDEGHLLKNEDSALSKAMRTVATLRRIVLTGTPLQNNLKEYHCMVQFVKPNLLGTKKEFLNRFVNPITNGQFDDSTEYDVKIMKKRAHVLHKMLEGCVQRFDYSVLTPFLPPKQEYVIFVKLSEFQIKMYQYYLDNCARRFKTANGGLFADFQALQRIWTHPYVLKLNQERLEKANEKKRLEASDSEGSLRDFIDDDSESSTSSSNSSDVQCLDSEEDKAQPQKRSTRNNPLEDPEVKVEEEAEPEVHWWSQFVEDEHFSDMRISSKLLLLFGILKESEQIGDKVLVFSQSLYSLTLLEAMLNLIDQETQNGGDSEKLAGHKGSWVLGADYFRLDGSTSPENRSAWCKIFNNTSNTRARLFLISTRAGGLGINLTAANRVIIFDASWNPSHDVQSIFRIYRFGQKKPCYVYRLLAAGTMEEKIYNRQVTKLSLACRVVDEQQIERHYSNHDLAELYQFEPKEDSQIVLALPRDRLLAEIFLKYKDNVYNYHEHDSLLENKEEEELDAEERQQAWDEYEAEKQGRLTVNPQNNFYQQFPFLSPSFPGFDSVKELIQRDYPGLPPEHLEAVARQAMFDMYRLVEQQQPAMNPYNPMGQAQMGIGNMAGAGSSMIYNQNQQFMQPRPGVNIMPTYSGRGRPPKILSNSNPQYVIPASAMQAPMNQSYPNNVNIMGGMQPGFIGNRVEEE